ncbi:phosphoribosyltransferase [Microbacterium terrisoli]|jgi:putative phosphoribosyl transferase|uniref:phosphoribosyltransferase n=1 Tax=Microbacterium terrisoli TaxID=3242192 RepID=UPI00280619C9|nr:phosphoribosyltransferase family protein [Microbacterium protaetiae]
MALYADRRDAGAALADELERWRGSDAVVVGIARGGVVVAAEVARRLGLPLWAIAARKLGAPGNAEFAIGAIAADARIVDERALRRERVSPDQLRQIEAREREALGRRQASFGVATPDLRDRPVLLVDDGVATGATAVVAARALRARSVASVVLAVPVAPARWMPGPADFDEVVCPHPARDFWAVGAFYDDFTQTTDEEVSRLLRGG